MCGIAGIYSLAGGPLPEFSTRKVLDTLRHRGPDDEGIYLDRGVFLGARRLAIIDPERGRQPVTDEAGRLHLVLNGELFDYDLLLKDLQARGHRFRSHCDTEVLVHLLEEDWTGTMDVIDGQFAFAAYDERDRRLLLARDRMGISPLFYTQVGEYLVFASEMKAIFATGLVRPVIDRRSLDAVLAFGCVPAPRTVFQGISALGPGRVLEVSGGVIRQRTYWDIPYNDAGQYPRRRIEEWSEEFHDILGSACRRRLKADVPVGVYLSGGIDSCTLASFMTDHGENYKQAFSVSFPEPGFDEGSQTARIAEFLGIRPHMLTYQQSDLARDLPRMIYHAETPLVSTEAVPLMALSELASQHVKVVLTGEGSDEALGGYTYFQWEALKEAVGPGWKQKVLLTLARPVLGHLLGKRNPFVPQEADLQWGQQTFGYYPAITMKFFYFRMIREMVYTPEMMARQEGLPDEEFLDLPREQMQRWDQYNRTLYLSSRIFMTNHLLAAHGDRALMAHSVEGRYPFLDRTVQEFLAAVPPNVKTRWHCGKLLLRRAMARRLPPEVIHRTKKPFLAPFGTPFVGDDATPYIRDLLSPAKLAEFGYFDSAKVERIVAFLTASKKAIAADPAESVRPNREAVRRVCMGMALTFVVSTQMLEDLARSG